MLSHVLHDGFSSVHRRVGLVFFDVLWKVVWLIATGLLLTLLLVLIASEFQSIQWDADTAPSNNPLALALLLRGLWTAYLTRFLAGLGVVAVLSMMVWLVMESFFRSRLLPIASNPEPGSGRLNSPFSNFKIFLASAIARTLVLLSAAVLVTVLAFGPFLTAPPGEWPALWEDMRGVALIGILILLGLAFLITVADTLIRSNAVHLLGTHMFEVAGIIGTLLVIEACLAGSGAIAVVFTILHASNSLEVVMAVAMAVGVALLMSTLHSYLLLVRFFSVDIMRRDVIDV